MRICAITVLFLTVFFLTVLVSGCSTTDPVSTVSPQSHPLGAQSSLWLEYEISELLPASEAYGSRKQLLFKVSSDSTYKLTQHITPLGSQMSYPYFSSGVLRQDQKDKLQHMLLELNGNHAGAARIKRGMGETEYGWGGHVSYTLHGARRDLKINAPYAQRGFESVGGQGALIRFIRQMNDFFWAELRAEGFLGSSGY